MEKTYFIVLIQRLITFGLINFGISRGVFLLKFHQNKDTYKNHTQAISFFCMAFFVILYFIKLELCI